jgi:hypothetical protein
LVWLDKTRWGPGPWQEEPDEVQWTDAATGLPCVACRHDVTGTWCGYVGVSAAHPWHGREADALPTPVDAHRGLTFSGLRDNDTAHADWWWFGFHTMYTLDYAPGLMPYRAAHRTRPPGHTVYRSLDYVRTECARLAGQLVNEGGIDGTV